MSNKKLLERAKVKLNGELGNKALRRLSTRFIERQMVLYAHIIRSGEDDPMKKISITEKGERVKADFRMAGRPRIKWYDTTRGHIITTLRNKGILNDQVARHEINDYIIKYVLDREYKQKPPEGPYQQKPEGSVEQITSYELTDHIHQANIHNTTPTTPTSTTTPSTLSTTGTERRFTCTAPTESTRQNE